MANTANIMWWFKLIETKNQELFKLHSDITALDSILGQVGVDLNNLDGVISQLSSDLMNQNMTAGELEAQRKNCSSNRCTN